MNENLLNKFLDIFKNNILPLTLKGVDEGNKIFGAAILNKDDNSIHGCHVATTVVGDYNNNDTSAAIRAEIAGHYDPFDTDGSNGVPSTFDPNYSTMGVAYNSKLHFADFGLSFTGGDHELAIEDAKAKGAKVHSNSWGISGDPTTTAVINTSGDNNYAKFNIFVNLTLTPTNYIYNEAFFTNNLNLLNYFPNNRNILIKYYDLAKLLKYNDWILLFETLLFQNQDAKKILNQLNMQTKDYNLKKIIKLYT